MYRAGSGPIAKRLVPPSPLEPQGDQSLGLLLFAGPPQGLLGALP